ncbi:PAS domain-containing protein [Pararhodonellum marinum]|uniref:PAS domain-containing protein n=1 Tax=Pararhodonellum marinum TaxID=2755358 RepID=UPI00188F17C1|nr:PAS domain-containing protein [Pararhodonellum marinum]
MPQVNQIGHRNTMEKEDYQSFFHTVLNQLEDGIFHLDPQWRFLEINQVALDYLGINKADIVDKNIWQIFPAYSMYHYALYFKEAKMTNQAVHFEEFNGISSTWYRVSVFPSAVGLTVIIKDIQEEYTYKEKLKTRDLINQSLLDNLEEGMVMIDGNCKVIEINRYAHRELEELFGKSLQAGDSVKKFLISLSQIDLYSAIQEAFLGGAGEMEVAIEDQNQNDVWYNFKFVPVFDTHKKIFAVTVSIKNINYVRRCASQLEAKEAMLRELTHMQSHVIRSPLSSLMGLLDLIDHEQLDKENQKYFKLLKPLAEEMDQQIRNNVHKITSVRE